MKKGLFALAFALFFGQSIFAQEEVQVSVINETLPVVEDASQGYLFNRFKDNWFITAEGGVNMLFSHADKNYDIKDRFKPAASIYVGKWFSPILGLRVGANLLSLKGLADLGPGIDYSAPMIADHYQQRYLHVGPVFDAMLNVTNWWCGYKPNRVYNFIIYGGVGMYWTLARNYGEDGSKTGFKNAKDDVLTARGGIINSFNLSKQVQLALDLRVSAFDNVPDQRGGQWHKTAYAGQAYLSLTYLFNKRVWDHPVVPVCPEPENCDAYRAALAAAEAQIADLEAQLAACLATPKTVEVIENNGPLATVYFPINVSRLSREDVRVVSAVAEIMKANPKTNYVVTGWADNYTGTDAINKNLRKNRAASVEKQLLKAGVNPAQVKATTNDGNLCDMGEKFVALDRAATIDIAE